MKNGDSNIRNGDPNIQNSDATVKNIDTTEQCELAKIGLNSSDSTNEIGYQPSEIET